MYARRGQCFSTTKHVEKLDKNKIEIIDDIKVVKTDDKY